MTIEKKASEFISDSEIFKKTSKLTIPASEGFINNEARMEGIIKKFEKVLERERELKNPDLLKDHGLLKDLHNSNKELENLDSFDAYIFRFKKNLTHKIILEECEKENFKKLSYQKALCIVIEAILQGKVDERNRGVFVYFVDDDSKDYNDQSIYRLSAFRLHNGELNISRRKVDLDGKNMAGSGICFID